ncbi:MAG: MFS transporter [Anaerolineae bacterium]|nr:MFS transporter [Anaerolineae bacterium]
MKIQSKLPSLQEYSRDARLLLSVSCLTAISFYGIQMLLRSLYLLRLGFDTAYVGSYLATGALAYMSMGIPSGALGSRFGTRSVMRIGGLISLVGMIMLPVVEIAPSQFRASVPHLAQLVQIGGWSMVNVNLVPALMGATSITNRNNSYALASGLREFGSFLGSLVGGLLPAFFSLLGGQNLDQPGPYRSGLWVGIVLWIVAQVPLFFIHSGQTLPRKKRVSGQGAFPFLQIAVLFLYVYIRHASWATCQSFCNPYMDQELRYSTATIGTITALGQILAIAASLFVPRLLKKHSTGWLLIGATLGVGLSEFILASSTLLPLITIGRLGVLVSMAIWLPTLQVYQMETVSESWRGLAYGSLSMAMGLGFASMGYGGGYVIDTLGYSSIFKVGAALSVLAAVMMFGILRQNNKVAERTHQMQTLTLE